MKNITTSIDKDTLTIKVDLSKDFGPSKSGKTIIIASSEGNVKVEGAAETVRMGLNVYRTS